MLVPNRPFAALALALAFTMLAACSGSGGGGPATGQVVVTLTDGPIDQYERLLVKFRSMTLIGSGGQQAIYDGPPLTFDLLQLRDRADFAFSQRVTAGDFSKIRLQVEELRLVDLGDPGDPADDIEVVLDNLPANGKIDLNPKGPFTVRAGRTLVIELDIDAQRSVQVVQQGNGGLRVRPVIFARIYEDDVILPSRLVRVFGTVAAVDGVAESMKVCGTEFVAQLGGPTPLPADACVRVNAAGASHFGTDGLPIGFADIVAAFNTTDDLPVTAIGFAAIPAAGAPADIALELDAVVDELGPRLDGVMPGWETTLGTVSADPFTTGCAASQCVDFLPRDSGTDITVQLQPTSRVFARDGTELAQSDLAASLAGAFDGLRVDNAGTEELRASLFVVGPDAGEASVTGALTAVALGASFDTLTVQPDVGGPVAVCVDADTDVLQVLTDGVTVTLVDLLDPAVLNPADGLQVEASGDNGSVLGCDIDAAVVIVE